MLAGAMRDPLDAFVSDPSELPPMCDEEMFAEVLAGMVAANAPRLFAVVQEYGDRVDARIAGWGMAFDDRADVVGVNGNTHLSGESADGAVGMFGFGTHITARVVWVNPDAALRPDEEP